MSLRTSLAAALAGAAAATAWGGTALAGPDPFIGQIVSVGENFCPRGYTQANGQLLPIQNYTALFSVIGCTYGGDCRSTFGVPDLRGRAMIGQGTGPGLPTYIMGQTGGLQSHTMTALEMPQHNHSMVASTNTPSVGSPSGAALPTYTNPNAEIYSSGGPGSAIMADGTIGNAGGSVPFNLYQPTQAVTMCLAVEGIYPPRG